jgi:hypothetical protein
MELMVKFSMIRFLGAALVAASLGAAGQLLADDQPVSPRLKSSVKEAAGNSAKNVSGKGSFSSGSASAFGSASGSAGSSSSGSSSGSGGTGSSESSGSTTSFSGGTVTLQITTDGVPQPATESVSPAVTSRVQKVTQKKVATGQVVKPGQAAKPTAETPSTPGIQSTGITSFVINGTAEPAHAEFGTVNAPEGQVMGITVTTSDDGNIIINTTDGEPLPGVPRTGMRLAGPVFVMSRATQLPDDVSVTFTKVGKEPGKLSVTRGDSKWEVPEQEMGTLPPEIQARVKGLFGRLSGPQPVAMPSIRATSVLEGQPYVPPQLLHGLSEAEIKERVVLMRKQADEAMQQARKAQSSQATTIQTAPLTRVFAHPVQGADIEALKAQQEALRKEVQGLKEAIEDLVKAQRNAAKEASQPE